MRCKKLTGRTFTECLVPYIKGNKENYQLVMHKRILKLPFPEFIGTIITKTPHAFGKCKDVKKDTTLKLYHAKEFQRKV